jgi:hypothetical protein
VAPALPVDSLLPAVAGEVVPVALPEVESELVDSTQTLPKQEVPAQQSLAAEHGRPAHWVIPVEPVVVGLPVVPAVLSDVLAVALEPAVTDAPVAAAVPLMFPAAGEAVVTPFEPVLLPQPRIVRTTTTAHFG